MKFDKKKACMEISQLISDHEISIDEDEYPQLSKMADQGIKLSFDKYFEDMKKN